jgi:acyl-coenzyme A thioesterase PaaI-like protein
MTLAKTEFPVTSATQIQIMFDPNTLVQKAKTSSFYKGVLNFALDRMIPFNKPHSFKVVEISDFSIKTSLPYKRRNFNHIRGIHACAMATISEFTTGFLLISKLDAKKYRLIMQRLEMNYHYQGKMDALATFSISEEWLSINIYEPLQSQEAVVIPCEVKIHDVKGNHLSTGTIFWQVKDWTKVKTKA